MWEFLARLARLDAAVIAWRNLHRSSAATAFMRFMTFVGDPASISVLGVVAVVLLLHSKRPHQAATVAAGLIGGWLLNELLKRLFHRVRPPQPWLTTASGYGFPSGHAMVSAAFFLVLAGCLSDGLAAGRRLLLVGAAVLLSALIGMSRVYLGVHYASDVMAGFVAGAVWAVLCLQYLQRFVK
jgi:undecaprenyl-diphosphatase